MKELKFRAWNDEKYIYAPNRFVYTDDYDKDDVDDYESIGHFFATRDNIEQYTGLKDKNGKEIYEGDIVNLEYYEKPFGKKRWGKTYPHKDGKDINVVCFEDGYFKFKEEDKDGYGSELAFSDYGEWEGKDGAYKYVAEVIGNIHENPELLKYSTTLLT